MPNKRREMTQNDIRRVIGRITANADACSEQQLHAFHLAAIIVMANTLDGLRFALKMDKENGIKMHSNIKYILESSITSIDSVLEISVMLPKMDTEECRYLVEKSLTTLAESLTR